MKAFSHPDPSPSKLGCQALKKVKFGQMSRYQKGQIKNEMALVTKKTELKKVNRIPKFLNLFK
jgi:hypothetical protein